MPRYAYECESCSYQFERRQSYSDDPIKTCPNCGRSSARRLITSVGVIFKGPGFYVTDNRKTGGNGKSAAKSSAKDSSDSSSKTAESSST